MKKLDKQKIRQFKKTVWDYYAKEGRHDLPWRKTRDPYKILVSEMMLQQTQVERVVPKYEAFLKRFPDIVSLSRAPLADVLRLWNGLGYNRRALYLARTAKSVVSDFGGKFPKDAETLETLSGIGPYTARAVATFAYGGSYTFIETNIRRVFIHEFFPRKKKVSDKELLPILAMVCPLDSQRVRDWYFALMDYGSHLKSVTKNPNRRSAQYAKQSIFRGSVREVRGVILRECGKQVSGARIAPTRLLASYIGKDKFRAEKALAGLVHDGFLDLDSRGYVTIRNS